VLDALFGRLGLALRGRTSLATLMDELAGIHGDRVLVSEHRSGRVLTYRAAGEVVARWSAGIARRTEPGDPVVVAMPSGYDQFLMCLAVARAGRLPAPVNDQMRPSEIEHVTLDAGASLVLRSARQLRGMAPAIEAADPEPTDVGALFYTSGTTGRPKGAALTHRSLVGAWAPAALWPSQVRDDEVVAALPVAHIMGFISYLGLAISGIRCYCLEQFKPVEVLEVLEARRSSGFIGVPAMYRRLLEAGAADRDLRSVRVWASGADAMPHDLVTEFKRFGASAEVPIFGSLGEASFVEGYGMVEVGGGVAEKLSPACVPSRLLSSIAMKVPGYRFRVVDDSGHQVPLGAVGELLVKGPGVLREYWKSPEATAETLSADGWLRTGDLVRRGPLGTIVFRGRSKQVIKSGGYSVYPLEVETVLEEHPEVLEASVFGAADPVLGEVPVAAVRLRPGGEVAPEELVHYVGERLSRYKSPRRVVVVDELPRTGSGKVQKDRLATLFDDLPPHDELVQGGDG
jgi:acyl-CoA synthetase (AMP-forming)/AMP-acid ligase II